MKIFEAIDNTASTVLNTSSNILAGLEIASEKIVTEMTNDLIISRGDLAITKQTTKNKLIEHGISEEAAEKALNTKLIS